MCRLTNQERYLGCGCIVKTGFKYKPEWCKAPNGVPFPKPELFDEPGRIPGRCCNEEGWSYSEVEIPGQCPRCTREWVVNHYGLGEVLERVRFKCDHVKDRPMYWVMHDSYRHDPSVVVSPFPRDSDRDTDPEDQEEHPPCWYLPSSLCRNLLPDERDLKEWHRVKRAWVLDYERLRATGKVRYIVKKDQFCGECDRKGTLSLYDALMMEPNDDTSGYRKRKPYALDISVDRARRCSAVPRARAVRGIPPNTSK